MLLRWLIRLAVIYRCLGTFCCFLSLKGLWMNIDCIQSLTQTSNDLCFVFTSLNDLVCLSFPQTDISFCSTERSASSLIVLIILWRLLTSVYMVYRSFNYSFRMITTYFLSMRRRPLLYSMTKVLTYAKCLIVGRPFICNLGPWNHL